MSRGLEHRLAFPGLYFQSVGAERTLKDFLPFGGRGNDAQEAASKAKVEALLKDKSAILWIQHDIVADAKLKKSPAYYE